MDTLYELSINCNAIVSTYDICEYLIARKSALMALTIAGIDYDITSNKHELNERGYFFERVNTKA